uniref:Uncharacterized protein n=1 Tax=Triticum urartu TaxID=4572 RepID=A0A8R7QL30_TRIUA
VFLLFLRRSSPLGAASTSASPSGPTRAQRKAWSSAAASAAQRTSTPAPAGSLDASLAAKRLNTRAALCKPTGFDETTSPLTALISAAAAAAARVLDLLARRNL